MIAKGYQLQGNREEADKFKTKFDDRQKAILTYCWDAEANFFMDYDFPTKKRTGIKSIAGMFPMFFEMASADVAEKVSGVIRREFLKASGVVTTLVDTDQQWDAPNGWAPLQWITYKGLKNYQIDNLANEIRRRWLRQNIRIFQSTGKMMEKYNVIDTTLIAGGGEYPNQDGFGWTNGVALAFIKEHNLRLEGK
jgi:alpha,alpha-trehalase